ncbi:phospholipase D family nuclease [Pantoea dispersa]|uniref:phospholipase D family nuclease n=1 Tax=Pantoea dispersa TaxID=59814 RepID=UPI00223B27A7|nr:phospholipase D family protein [Pantoea dispersa]
MTALLILPVIRGAEASVTAGFSPGGPALDLILQFTGSARQSADVAAYDFTSRTVAQALSAAVTRGVKVRLVADEKKSRDRWSLVSQLACAGVDVRLNGMYSIMHNKFIVADGSAVETGSFNYTSSAEKRNAENAMVIKDEPGIARQYQAEFNRLWNESVPVACERTERTKPGYGLILPQITAAPGAG